MARGEDHNNNMPLRYARIPLMAKKARRPRRKLKGAAWRIAHIGRSTGKVTPRNGETSACQHHGGALNHGGS